MAQNRFVHRLWLGLAVVTSVILLSGCSGGGGGGHGALLLITADGASEPLWSDGTVPGVCPARVFVNANIRFTFDSGVDPSSLPGGGIAVGSINITTALGDIPAQGTFTVEDEPAFPAGNNRVVVFRPTLPSNPANVCSAGIAPAQIYQIALPGQGFPQVVVAGGGEITQGAFTCFTTCGCPDPGVCITTFMDPVAGAPFVLDTTPGTGDPAPAPIDACSIANNTVIIRVNEPLDPNGIDLTSVKLINVATGAQVPGTLVFDQAGNTTGTDIVSRIDYVATTPFTGSRTYQIVFGPGVKDLAGNPIQTAPQLFFQTTATPTVPQPPLVENFDTPGETSGAAAWTGDGFLRATFPVELTGTGADGAFTPAVGMTTLLDTNQLVNGVSRQGVWNFTTVIIQLGATVRIIGPYLAHFRCTGPVSNLGVIQVIPGQISPPVAVTPAYDKGAQMGLQQNGLGTDCEANGGVGNAGGGAGGAGSGITPPSGSPPTFQCTVRALKGENGYGPTLNGLPNDGSVPNPFYAGGQGGISGCFPSFPPCTTSTTDLGGLGGAGGTAARLGEPGQPRMSTAACLPNPNVTQPIAQPSPIPVALIPPIGQQSAGSGGGGGGDHLESTGTPPNNDDQGGGGGGGGGGLRISCAGAYTQGNTGSIVASGANGGNAVNASGAGGSGSGGVVWIQSFGVVSFAASSLIAVVGPSRLFPSVGLIGCSSQASGGGGPGLVQVESGSGPPPGAFNIQPTPTPTSGAVYINPPFIHAGGMVTGQGRSDLRYAGVSSPDYTSAVEVFSLGNATGATVMIRYEGVQEAVNSTMQLPVPDPATIKTMASGGGPITAANLDELDGYAFIKFIVDFSYPAPPMTSATAILPSVDSITINFSAPVCL